MRGFKKSHINNIPKSNHGDPAFSGSSSNPFDYVCGSDNKETLKSSQRTSSEPNLRTNHFDDDFENRSVQDLEYYAVHKAEETTKMVNNCLKIAVDMREDATNTLAALHHQGEQITKTHLVAADIDQDLTRGEKLLGSLGGIFSRTWKPKKNHSIRGPNIMSDSPIKAKRGNIEQMDKLGLSSAPKGRSNPRIPYPEPTNTLQKIEMETANQDDTLSDISTLLGELKVMAVDMGSEIGRHNKALDDLDGDVEELNFRVKGANQRGRRLLGK